MGTRRVTKKSIAKFVDTLLTAHTKHTRALCDEYSAVVEKRLELLDKLMTNPLLGLKKINELLIKYNACSIPAFVDFQAVQSASCITDTLWHLHKSGLYIQIKDNIMQWRMPSIIHTPAGIYDFGTYCIQFDAYKLINDKDAFPMTIFPLKANKYPQEHIHPFIGAELQTQISYPLKTLFFTGIYDILLNLLNGKHKAKLHKMWDAWKL
jgi:hypothetical protein